MKRRKFLAASVVVAGAGTLTTLMGAPGAKARDNEGPEFYELRLYHLRRGPKQKLFDDYMQSALLPAMSRLGIGPIGVFSVITGPDSPTMYVLIPYKSAAAFISASDALQADAEYQRAGAKFLEVPATDPSFVRMESSFMRAFAGMPKLSVSPAAANKSQIFELRTYESHSQAAHLKKVQMFNDAEIAIFKRTGLEPVFFGQTLAGGKLPNLTYMLTFENMAAHDANWQKFIADAEWKKLSATPGFTDGEIVSNISNVFLRATAYSQV